MLFFSRFCCFLTRILLLTGSLRANLASILIFLQQAEKLTKFIINIYHRHKKMEAPTTFVQLHSLTSKKGQLLNGRTGFVNVPSNQSDTTTASNHSNHRLSLTLFPINADMVLPETISIKKKNITLLGETPTSEFDFSLDHFQEWKTRLLGDIPLLGCHPASSPLNALSLQEAASAVSNDDLFGLYLQFRYSESGYANGTHVVHSPLGIINAKSPTGVATLHVEPQTKSISATCHAQWEDITTRLRTLIPIKKLNDILIKEINSATNSATGRSQREHWQSGSAIEPTYFQHLYQNVTPRELSQHGIVLEGVTDDDYFHWQQNDYKLTLRIPDTKEVLHVTVPKLSPSDISGGCCHTLSETLFLRGCVGLDIIAVCSGFVLTTVGTWVREHEFICFFPFRFFSWVCSQSFF